MLNGITNQSVSLIAAIQNISSSPGTKSDFAAASSELSKQVALLSLESPVEPQGMVVDKRLQSSGATTTMEVEAKDVVEGTIEEAVALDKVAMEDVVEEEGDEETIVLAPLAILNYVCPVTKLELDTCPCMAMTSDELWDPASLFQHNSSEEEACTRLVSSIQLNHETVCCNPNAEPQVEFDEPESNQMFAGISWPLTLETVPPRTLSSICVATCSPANPQVDRTVSAIGSKTRHLMVSPEELSSRK
jgi:hypothetical protein